MKPYGQQKSSAATYVPNGAARDSQDCTMENVDPVLSVNGLTSAITSSAGMSDFRKLQDVGVHDQNQSDTQAWRMVIISQLSVLS